MERIKEEDVSQAREIVAKSLDAAQGNLQRLSRLLRLEGSDIWDLQLQAAKEAVEELQANPESSLPAVLNFYQSIMSQHLEIADSELPQHIDYYEQQLQLVEKLPRVLELARLALCGHRVCWHAEHVVRRLSHSALESLKGLTSRWPDNRQLRDLAALAEIEPASERAFVVNRGTGFRTVDIGPRIDHSQFCRHLKPPDLAAERYIRHRYLSLPNGLRVLLSSDPTATEDQLHLRVNAGSFYDGETPGLAHLAEHVMVTQKSRALFPSPSFLETIFRARTAYEATNYSSRARKGLLEKTLKRFADSFAEIILDATLIQREIRVIQRESTYHPRSKTLLRGLYRIGINEEHPFARSTMGSKHTLDVPDIAERLRRFYDLHYTADNLTLVVRSSQSLDDLQCLVERFFKFIPRAQDSSKPALDIPPMPNPLLADKYIHVYHSHRRVLALRWSGLKWKHRDHLLLLLMRALFSLKLPPLSSHTFKSFLGPDNNLVLIFVHPVSKKKLHQLPKILESLSKSLLKSFQTIGTAKWRFQTSDFVEASAELLATLDGDDEIRNIPYYAQYGPCLDDNLKGQLKKVIKHMARTSPEVIVLSPESPPPDRDLLPVPDTDSVYQIRLRSELHDARSANRSSEPPKVVEWKFVLSTNISFASRLMFFDEFLRHLMRHHKGKARLALQDKNISIKLSGSDVTNWDGIVSDLQSLLEEAQAPTKLENLMAVADARAKSRLAVAMRQQPLKDMLRAYLFDIKSIDAKRFSFMTDPIPSRSVTCADIKSFVLGLLRTSTVGVYYNDDFPSTVPPALVKALSSSAQLSFSFLEMPRKLAYTSKPSPRALSTVTYSLVQSGNVYYIPPSFEVHDAAVGVFFQWSRRSLFDNFDDKMFPKLVAILENICREQAFKCMRLELHLVYSLQVECSEWDDGMRFLVQGKKSPDLLMGHLEDLLRKLPDIIRRMPLDRIKDLCVDLEHKEEDVVLLPKVRESLANVAMRAFSPDSPDRKALWVQLWPQRLDNERTNYVAQMREKQANVRESIDEFLKQ